MTAPVDDDPWFIVGDAHHSKLCNHLAGRKVNYHFTDPSERVISEGIGRLTFYSKRLSRVWSRACLAIVNADGDVVEWAFYLPRHALENLREAEQCAGVEFELVFPWDSVRRDEPTVALQR